jgi:Ankyrin repeats (3 copies)
MTASVAPFTMDFIHPPIPGQVHQYYGSIHNTQLLLPAITDQASPKVSPKPKPKPKPQPKPKRESTSLYTAASNGNLQKLKELLNENNNVNQDQPITGLTLLHFAASRGHLDVTRSLCEEYGASTDIEDREGEVIRVLHFAIIGEIHHAISYISYEICLFSFFLSFVLPDGLAESCI